MKREGLCAKRIWSWSLLRNQRAGAARAPLKGRRETGFSGASGLSPSVTTRGTWKNGFFFLLHQVKTSGKVLHASVAAKGISGKGPISAGKEKLGPIATQAKAGRPEKGTESSSEDDSDSEDDEPVAVTTPQVKPRPRPAGLSARSELCTHRPPSFLPLIRSSLSHSRRGLPGRTFRSGVPQFLPRGPPRKGLLQSPLGRQGLQQPRAGQQSQRTRTAAVRSPRATV